MFESVVDRFFGHDDHKNFKLNDSFKSYYSNKNPQFGYNGLGETTYYRTYSRIKEDGTKERFFDTAVRIIEGTYEIQRRYCKWLHLPYDIGKAQESAQEMFERMWAFKWLPPGRGMWTMGTPFMWRSGGASLNNCFKGDTEFITREGIKKLGDCVNTIQKVLTSNGKWVDAKIKSFGIQPLQKVIIRRGRWRKSIFATADHRWFVHSKSKKFATIGAADNSKNACIRECITSELESGVRLSMNFGSGINNTNLRPSAFGIAHGICFGDGTTGSDNENHGTYLYLCKPKDEQLEKFFSACYKTEAPEKGEHGAIRVADLPRMFRKIPDLNESSTYLYGFLVGYFAADGDVTNNGTVRIASSERSNLELVQSICAILGIGTYEISQGLQTVHHKGKIKKFVGYRLTLMAEHLNSEFFLIDEHKQRFNARIKTSRKKIPTYQSWYVESVEDTPLIEEVFCPQVPETYCFTLAGNILTGNCGFVSTNDEIELDPSTPFAFAMDMLMLGVGIGFDTKGSDRIKIKKPHAKTTKYIIEDSREGWVHALSDLIRSYTIKQEFGNLQFDYGLIRPKGSLIKGFGGEASGPEGLRELLESTNEFLATRIKTRLTSVDIADLMNLVGKCVVAGNVRRSAEIAFGFPNDIEYRSMKNPTRDLNAEEIGEFYKITGKLYSENRYKANLDDFEFTNIDRSKLSRAIEVWNAMNDRRWASNNSVFSEVGMDYTEVGHSTALNGEPGYIWLDNMRDFGRMKDGRQPGIDGRVMGSNPCVSGDTRIQTKDGAFKIIDCVDKEVEVWNGQKWSKVTPRKTGTNKFLRRVKLSDGSYLDATPNHRWSIIKESGELAEIETDSLMANDKLETFSLPVIDGVLSIPDLLGKLAAGDNTVFHEVVDVYGEIVANELLDNRQPLPDVIFTMGTNDCSKFLLAWAKTKGVIAIRDSSIILISISNRRLHELQILARRAGQSDTIIHSDSLIIRNISGQLAILSGCKNDAEPIINEQLVVSVDIIAGTHDTYCFEEPELHKGVFNNVLTHQCVEQTLESYELCVSGDTMIQMRDGVKPINELVGESIEIWNGDNWSKVSPRLTGSNRELFRVHMSDGSYLDTTSNHGWLVKPRGKKIYRRVDTINLEPGSMVHSFALNDIKGKYEPNAFEMGYVVGDGFLDLIDRPEYTRSMVLCCSDAQAEVLNLNAISYKPQEKDGYSNLYRRYSLKGVVSVEQTKELRDINSPLPHWIFEYDRDSIFEFVAGWIESDGSIARQSNTDGYRIYGTELHIRSLQLLLRRIGINHASVNFCHPKGQITNKGVRKYDLWYVQIPSFEAGEIPTRHKIATKIGSRLRPNPRYPDKLIDCAKKQRIIRVEKLDGLHDTYCFDEPNNHMGVFGNSLTYQCNLVETFPVKNDDEVDYMRTIKYAYLYGKTVTLLPTHNDRTNRVMLRNRRIGLSQSGIVQGFEKFGRRRYIDNFCDAAYSEIKRWDRIYSEYLVCRQSIKVTSIKPSGTVSLIAGVTPGIHFPEARSYWRRMRLAANSVLVKVLKDAGYHVEPAMTDPDNTVVVTFGVEDVGVRPIMDVSIWEQMDNVAAIQHYWADNAVSVTIQFKPEEAKDIPKILEHYEDRIKAVSFLPHSTHGYVQAPYEQAEKEDVVAYNSKLKPIDFSLMFEEAVGEKFCSNDTCVIG